jgi:hypothetical protein
MAVTNTGIYASDGTSLYGEADVDQHVGVVGCLSFRE